MRVDEVPGVVGSSVGFFLGALSRDSARKTLDFKHGHPGASLWGAGMDDDEPPNVVTSISRHELTAVAQRDLLHWLNRILQTDYGQVTEVNDGVAHLQILDAVWPRSKVPLHRLNFHPRTKDDRERNLRVVRQTLQRLRVVEDAPLDVEPIARGGPQSFTACNDILRWLHAVVQRNCPAVTRRYDAHGRRRQAQTRQSRSSPMGAGLKDSPSDRWYAPTSRSPKGKSYLDLFDEPASDASPSPTMARREAMYEYTNEREGFVRRRAGRPKSAGVGVRSSAPEFGSERRRRKENRSNDDYGTASLRGSVGYAPSEETDDVYSEYRVPAVRRRPATARTVRSSGLHRWAAKVRAGKVDKNTEEEGGDYHIGGNETDDVDDDGDVDSTLDVVVDRVSDVPTTPRRVQSTRLSAWASRSRVLTPVKSDDTEEEDTEEEEEEEEEDTDTAPTPVRSSPSQNLADARRELRIRRTEEAERGARKILVSDAAASDEENQDDGDGFHGQSPYVDEAEAAERRERIMRETKAELREIKRREAEKRTELASAANAEAERERARELRRAQLRRSHGLKESPHTQAAAATSSPTAAAGLTVVVEETTSTMGLEETAQSVRQKRADLESLAEYLKWELAREVKAFDVRKEEVADLVRERDEAVHRLGLGEARRRMRNLAA